jgi:hypothetical protein
LQKNRPVGKVKQTDWSNIADEGTMTKAADTREKICQAAIRTVTRDGLLAMTLDNVAKEAGLSKGGVMYHFASKDSLVEAMLTYFSEGVERMLLEQVAADPEPRHRWVRAMLTCLFPDPTGEPGSVKTSVDGLSPEVQEQFMLAMVAAAANAPHILAPLRRLGAQVCQRLLSEEDDGMEQLLLWLAVDGLFLWQFVGLIDRDDPLFHRIGEALRQKADVGRRAEPGGERRGADRIARSGGRAHG